ncbi:PAS domain-containing protein [Burkholderiaceae bacterium DAT-1]|nr:PAS domain-containing protein [Burkholderiaceae bacterium DAT-1]
MKSWLNNVMLSQKLGAMVLIAIGLFSVPSILVWEKLKEERQITLNERAGMGVMAQSAKLMALVENQRRELSGSNPSDSVLKQITTQVDEAASKIRSDPVIGEDKDLKASLDDILKAQRTGVAAKSGFEGFLANTRVVDEVLGFQSALANKTGMSLDPEATSYYLYNAAYVQMPLLMESLSRARDAFGGDLYAKINESALYLNAVDAYFLQLDSSMRQMSDMIDLAARAQSASNDEEMAGQLQKLKESLAKSIEHISGKYAALKQGKVSSEDVKSYNTSINETVQLAAKATSEIQELLDGEFQQRLDDNTKSATKISLMIGIMFALMLAVSYFIGVSISKPIRSAVSAASRIASGNLDDARIRQEGRNEISKLLQALDDMRIKLAESLSRERAEALENARIRTALDCSSAAIMITDLDRRVVYHNQAVTDMFAVHEADIRTALPQFRADAILGKQVEEFHHDRSAMLSAISNMAGTLRSQLQLGSRRFQIALNRVINANGESLGVSVEWVDETESLLEIERERERAAAQARVLTALDNASVNVMIADTENCIIYMNGAMRKTLKDAESNIRNVMPTFAVDDIIGSSFDRYHANPSKQANMIGNLTSKHETKMHLAGHHFRLVANPIHGEDGIRLGTVVEWNEVTREVAIENEVESLIHAANMGNFGMRLSTTDKDGFFRSLAESLNNLMGVCERGLADVISILSALSEGDLTVRMEGEYHGDFARLRDDSNATAERLAAIIDQIKTASDTISVVAHEIADGNQNLSRRTESQAANIEETASSMEEFTGTVKQNADNAKEANKLARGARDIAEAGGQVVGKVVETMQDINESARKIVDIISVIDGIAFQTNILALNAAVEAARAGEQGRGFAVVASEVRNLAQRSAAAAKEIKSLISDSVGKVEVGAKLVDDAGKQMQQVVNAVKGVTDIVSEISAASAEQSTGIEQVNQAVMQMDDMTQQNAALVEEAAAAAQSMADQAVTLSQSVAAFRLPQTKVVDPKLVHAIPEIRSASPKRVTSPSNSGPVLPRSMNDQDDWEEF